MSAHVGLGPSSLADSFLLPGRFPRLSRAATSTRSHQRGFRLLYLTGHFEPRSVEQLRHGQAQHARPRSSLLLLHSGRLAVSSPLRGEPASSVTAHCRGATTTAVFCYRLYAALSEPCTSPRAPSCFLCHSPLSRSYYNRSFATGYSPRSVGPAHHLYKFLSSSPRACAPLLRHPRVP
jgi:hypothetical protein